MVWMNTYTGEIVDTIWEVISNTVENLIHFHFWAPKWKRVEILNLDLCFFGAPATLKPERISIISYNQQFCQ